ncbi:MAG: electron transport complex subunit RsxB [Oceanococcaceae bacterium]
MLAALLAFGALAGVIGVALGLAAVRFRVEGNPLVEQIDAVLPQTQCGQCGYPGCRPYAEAIAEGAAEINQCPPGGEDGIIALAELLGREPLPLNPENGEAQEKPLVAWIDESLCIGCTLCIQACPVDAIVGANKLMHTVIAAECTGCKLCLPPCPVDCIELHDLPQTPRNWAWPDPARSTEAA